VDQRIAARDACEIEHVVGPETLRRLTAFVEYATRGHTELQPVMSGFEEYLLESRVGRRGV